MGATEPPTPETTPPPLQTRAGDKLKISDGKHRTTKHSMPSKRSSTPKTSSRPKLSRSNKLKKSDSNCRITKSTSKSVTKPTPKHTPKITPEASPDPDTNAVSIGKATPAASQIVGKEDCEELNGKEAPGAIENADMDKEHCSDTCHATDIDVPATSTNPLEDATQLSDSDLTDLEIEDIYEPTEITRSTAKTKSKSNKRGRGAAPSSVPVLSQARAPKRKFSHLFEMHRKKPAPAVRSPSPETQPVFQSTTISLPSGEKLDLHPTRFEYPAAPEDTFEPINRYITRPEKIMPDWLKDRPHLRPERAERYYISPPQKKVIPTGPVVPATFKKSSKPNQFGKVPKFNIWQVVQGKKGTATKNKLAGMSLRKGGGVKIVKVQPKAREQTGSTGCEE